MTRGLEDAFGLPHLEDVISKEDREDAMPFDLNERATEKFNKAIAAMDDVEQRLMHIEGASHSAAMDEIYEETLKHSRDLMDFGFNVDPRSARGIFEVATSMYKNAIDAQNSKRDAQLKIIKLMMDKQKSEKNESTTGQTIVGEAIVLAGADRNEIIRRLREQKND